MSSTAKVAIITGAGSGIGRHAAIALAENNYSVALAGRHSESLEETAGLISEAHPNPLVVPTDVSDADSIANLFAKTEDAFGRLDLLFNNAGTGAPPTTVLASLP